MALVEETRAEVARGLPGQGMLTIRGARNLGHLPVTADNGLVPEALAGGGAFLHHLRP
ncbi:hypothetical protein DFAR_860008 [Desulfarculales bacterium]